MWFLPLLVLGAIVAAAVSRSPREVPAAAPPQLPPGPGPGPIAVLGEFMRIRQTPPPTVILCAIAEAETLGRNDVASDIIRLFVAPVVYRHQMQPPAAAALTSARGSCAPVPSRSPREASSVLAATPEGQNASSAPQAPVQASSRPATDEEIRAMLNADPQKFLEMATRGMPVIEVPVDAVHPTTHQGIPVVEVPVEAVQRAAQAAQSAQSPEVVAQMQEAAGLHAAADQTRALAPGSPIAGVSDGAWREFVVRLEREPPQFNSTRHVGQYRHRRERLAEIGMDPSVILGSAQAQRAALDIDLVDAHRHATAGGMLEHLGRAIAVPGQDKTEPLTLSGMLGVIQCAGLEGAVGWFENSGDRKRYPHTTQAFLRTNGVF